MVYNAAINIEWAALNRPLVSNPRRARRVEAQARRGSPLPRKGVGG